MLKRLFDFFLSCCGLVLLSPLLFLISAAIKIEDQGPVFFRQERVGRYGRPFFIHKFRTMFVGAENRGLQITVGLDVRITRIGSFLRKYKLDELPQLLNILKGDMSFVGPRPEVPRYISLYPTNTRDLLLSVRPGLTDLASIEFRNESLLLAEAVDPEKEYLEKILPVKLGYHTSYVRSHTLSGDILILVKTLKALLQG